MKPTKTTKKFYCYHMTEETELYHLTHSSTQSAWINSQAIDWLVVIVLVEWHQTMRQCFRIYCWWLDASSQQIIAWSRKKCSWFQKILIINTYASPAWINTPLLAWAVLIDILRVLLCFVFSLRRKLDHLSSHCVTTLDRKYAEWNRLILKCQSSARNFRL